MNSGGVISHKWLAQVLRQRGIPAPAPEVIRSSIEQATPDQRHLILNLSKRVEAGSEGLDDIDRLRALISVPTTTTDRNSGHAASGAPNANEGRPKPSTYAEEKLKRPKHHIYSAKAALTVEVDRLREHDELGNERWTLMLEAAQAKAARQYDWEHKIAFQFMRRELPLLAAALLGLISRLELRNHGQSADKSVLIEDQGDKVFVKVGQGSRIIPVPVVSADVHAWLELVMLVIKKNAPEVGDVMHMAMIQRVAEMETRKKSNG